MTETLRFSGWIVLIANLKRDAFLHVSIVS